VTTASTDAVAPLRAVFAGRRGRLLAGLLLAELAGAIGIIAYASVLPLAARDLHGGTLYGATLAAGTLTTILTLATGVTLHPARRALFVSTVLYGVGVITTAVAPAMAVVLAGSVLRGAGAGLLAGFGMSAIGGLYEGALRRRVLGLFAIMWLLPSLAGPALNALVASAVGWRWALAWPAAIVIVARVLIGRDADVVPWQATARRVDATSGPLVVGGLALASVAPELDNWWALVPYCLGTTVAVLAAWRTLRALIGPAHARLPVVAVLGGVSLAFFGGDAMIALAVVEGTGYGVLAASAAVGAGLVAWSIVGLRPSSRDHAAAGVAVVGLGLALVAVALGFSGAAALAGVVIAWAIGGVGMGIAYPRLTSDPFDELPPEQVTAVGTALAFAELAGGAVGALLGGGLYSLAAAAGAPASSGLVAGFVLLAAAALVGAASRQFGAASRLRRTATSRSTSG
jgi:MFS family permease